MELLRKIATLLRFLPLLFVASFACANTAFAETIHATATFQYQAIGKKLQVNANLKLFGGTLYNARINVIANHQKQLIRASEYWPEHGSIDFTADISGEYRWRGEYPLIIEIAAQDNASAWLSLTISNRYFVDRIGNNFVVSVVPDSVERPTGPSVSLRDHALIWETQAGLTQIEAVTTSSPAWTTVSNQLTPEAKRFELRKDPLVSAMPSFEYAQVLAINWIDQDSQHFTKFIPWTLVTDNNREWHATTDEHAISELKEIPFWRNSISLYTVALVFFALFVLVSGWKLKHASISISKFYAIFIFGVVMLWMIGYLAPSHWFSASAITGGDMASHFLYAQRFIEWFFHGRWSNWMPEVFAGFPAFTFYFPFPFAIIALLSLFTDANIAIKLGVVAPGLLLPIATFWLGGVLAWSYTQRLLAGLASIAFLLTTETSIWGGNWQGVFAGEFSYQWAFTLSVVCFGLIVRYLQTHRKQYFIAAVLIESAVAMSHGFAVIWLGLSTFAFLVFSSNRRADFFTLLSLHSFAFLLIGFWIIPLLAFSSWTIPNDGSLGVVSWNSLWGKTLWPFTIGIVLLPFYFRAEKSAKITFALLSVAILVGLLGYFSGRYVGLAEIRFYPFAQWATAIACAISIGWAIDRMKRPFIAIISIAAALLAWWQPFASSIEQWSRWNLGGYEEKPTWSLYRQLALSTRGALNDPRIAFEHDPDNNDLGSTRALEALPYFGSRPVLEGLYMESSISAPFIYQIQADISQRPSSPLARYPVFGTSVKQTIARMQEFYTDTLILRSNEMKSRFRESEEFDVLLDRSPFLVLKLKHLETDLIEPIITPVTIGDRKNWIDQAFKRFRTEFPYQQRRVFDPSYNEIRSSPPQSMPDVRIMQFERDRIVFETNQIGVPHLIRMTYNTRWRATNGDRIFLTEPSFMLIVPTANRIELEYGYSWTNYLGWVFTLLGVVLTVYWYRKLSTINSIETINTSSNRVFYGFLVFATILTILGYWFKSDAHYYQAHQLLRHNQYSDAAELFDQAVAKRRVPAFRAEALFWSARSHELANHSSEAKQRFRTICTESAENYWWPESCFRLIALLLKEDQYDEASDLFGKLNELFPENRWTGEAQALVEKDNRVAWSKLLRRR